MKKNSISRKEVAIILPIYKNFFTDDEIISLNTLKKLKGFPFYVLIPENLKNSELPELRNFKKNFKKIVFEDRFFKNRSNYSKLLRSYNFYKCFKNFKYILIYQTDCLIFRGNLLEFCRKGYDYIGAPIFTYRLNGSIKKVFVGNGGLSLRKIETFLKISRWYSIKSNKLKFKIFKLIMLPFHTLEYIFSKKPRSIPHFFTNNEDIFWSLDALRFFPDFQKPTIKEAAKFSIERELGICLKLNNGQLPFGCHAFNYYRDFWLSKIKQK